jgi:hypothetical protein
VETVNVYNKPTEPSWPDDHPGRIPMQRSNAFVATDRIPDNFMIARLYSSDVFRRFVADCFGLTQLSTTSTISPTRAPISARCAGWTTAFPKRPAITSAGC